MAVSAGVRLVRVVGASVALLLVVGSAASLVEGFFEQARAVRSDLAAGVSTLVVQLDVGSVTVRPATADEPGRVTRTLHWVSRQPRTAVTAAGSTTTVTGQCPGTVTLGSHCRVDVDVVLPPGVALQVRTDVGDVTAAGLSSSQVSVRTGTGDVDVRFVDPPVRVDLRTSTGDVTVAVPTADGAGYLVDARAAVGDVVVRVPSDPGAARRLTVATITGDIDVGPS